MRTCRTLMVQGTASHVGKSFLTAAFCRLFAQCGYRVAPFKAQNMSNNSFVTPEGGEIGRAQAFQAEAAGVQPHVDMNPVLLKPGDDTSAQVVVLGEPLATMDVREYQAFQRNAFDAVSGALVRLRQRHDLVVIEGAGSPAEINLRQYDIANMAVAELADAPVLLVGDIDRGGVFAALTGTLDLLPLWERQRVKATLINKFRGEKSLLEPGVSFLEQRTATPVLGVIPWTPGLVVDEEDAVNLEVEAPRTHVDGESIDVGVLRLPHISNATDFQPLARTAGVNVRYIDSPRTFGPPDVVVIPGTKSTVADLRWIRRQGLADCIVRHARDGGRTIGICGGFQMMGREIRDEKGVESSGSAAIGLGLFPVVTRFHERKTLCAVNGECVLPDLLGARIRGYEIHHGSTLREGDPPQVFHLYSEAWAGEERADGTGENSRLFGTYIHGLFDHVDFRSRYLNLVRQDKGLETLPEHMYDTSSKSFDDLAEILRDSVDLRKLGEIVGLSVSGDRRLR